MTGQFTGRHMTAILVTFFAVIIAVNVMMARLAGSTFGGTVVENSYVASQHFNRWLDEAAKEKALGWHVEAKRLADGRIEIVLGDKATDDTRADAIARHPLGRFADRTISFATVGNGRFVSRQALPAGRWVLRLKIESGHDTWRTEQEVF